MNPLLIAPILEIGKTLLDRFGPADAGERARMEADFLKMAADGELKQVIAQLEINAREAAHPSLLVSGWRPSAGWCGVAGLAYATIVHPSLVWLARIQGWPEPPVLDTDLLWVVLTGMLGIGGLRSLEKVKGAAR